MESHAALECLKWQIELGATEAIGEAPVNRYALPETAPKPKRAAPDHAAPQAFTPAPATDPVADAEARAKGAASLEALAEVQSAYPHCELKRGARNFVFADGHPGARVMVIGEAPGRDEDLQGLPFVGRAGQMLDAMFGAIGLARGTADPRTGLYITNVLPWRPPQNRDPKPEEIAMMLPFVRQHIDLAKPELLILMGNHSCQALLGKRGLTRLRGTWTEAAGLPALPMFHPAYLLRNPSAKREAWADLLSVQARLRA